MHVFQCPNAPLFWGCRAGRGSTGGEGGIRTHGPLARSRALQARLIDHSSTSPPAGGEARPSKERRRRPSMAEGVGFEPTVRLHAHRFSRAAPSTTRTPLRSHYSASPQLGRVKPPPSQLTSRILRP